MAQIQIELPLGPKSFEFLEKITTAWHPSPPVTLHNLNDSVFADSEFSGDLTIRPLLFNQLQNSWSQLLDSWCQPWLPT